MNHIAPPSWVPPSNTHQCTVRPMMSLMLTGAVTLLPGISAIRASAVRMFSRRKRLLQTVNTVLAATKGSQRVSSLRLTKCTSPPRRLKNHPLSIKNSAMWNK